MKYESQDDLNYAIHDVQTYLLMRYTTPYGFER